MPNKNSPSVGNPRLNLPKPYQWANPRNTLQGLMSELTMSWMHRLAEIETPPDPDYVYALQELKDYFDLMPANNFPPTDEETADEPDNIA